MKIQLPSKVNKIINELIQHGYEAYAVGGCVRDSILGRSAEDWDITTSASPYEVKALFRRTVDTGIKHGTVTVMLDKEGFEVTTYRIDGEYEDGRHPKEVQFTKSLVEDLKRRDFTINAMAYNDSMGLVDLFGGIEDLDHKVIRCVGNPGERFDEDALRILRAFRFSAQLCFTMEEQTRKAAEERATHLTKISAERIRTELNKLLLSKHPDRLLDASESKITKVILPEFDEMLATAQNNSNHTMDVGSHTVRVIELVGNPEMQQDFIEQNSTVPFLQVVTQYEWSKKELQVLKWAALLHDVAKPHLLEKDSNGEDFFPNHAQQGAILAKQIMQRLKFDNETIDLVVRLIAAHDYYRYERSAVGMRQTMHKFGPDLMNLLWELQLGDVLAQNPTTQNEKLKDLSIIKRLHQEVKHRGDCVSLKQLAVSGKDLLEVGVTPGKKIGEMLLRLLEEVLVDPEKNRKDYLIAKVKQYLS